MAEDKLIVGLSADIRDLQTKLGEAQNILKGYAKEAENIGNKGNKGFNNITNSIKGLIGAYVGLQAAQAAVSKAFNTALQLDSIEAAYTQIFKSSEIATLQLERLKVQADELGLSFMDLATSYKSFAGAAYTTGLTLKQTNEIFDAVTNAAAQMKLNSEQTQGTLLALSQMISKGTVSMEELRQQLGERLPGAMKIFADGLGVSVEELNKMIASGKVMANDALPKFAARLNEVYKTTEPIKGLQAAVNRLSNAFTDAVSGGAIGKFFELIVNGATKAIGVIENAYKGFQLLINKSSFQGNQIFDSGVGEINKLFETGGDKAITQLAELIAEYNKLGKAYGYATEEGKAYLELIKIAGAAQQELLTGTKKTTIQVVNSIISLENQLKTLTESYKSVEIGSKEFIRLGKEIDNVKAKLENLRTAKIAPLIKFEMPTMDSQFLTANVDLKGLEGAVKPISDFQAQTNMLNGSLKELEAIGGSAFTPIQIGVNNIAKNLVSINSLTEDLNIAQRRLNETTINTEEWTNLSNQVITLQKQLDGLKTTVDTNTTSMVGFVNIFSQGLTGAFEAALNGTQSFGQAFENMLKQLIARLLAAVAAAAALAALISIATGGANLKATLGKLGIKGGFGGLLNLTSGGLIGGAGNRVVSPVGAGAMAQGSVEFNIMGDKLYGVLKNYTSRLDRLQ